MAMQLKILLPFQVFADVADVSRVVVDTPHGEFGLLPKRLDCVAPIAPGILIYESEAEGEVFIAVDQGIMVKAGGNVLVSVRRAIRGADLAQLHAAVEQEFLTLDEHEQQVRSVMAKLENGLLHRFATFQHE